MKPAADTMPPATHTLTPATRTPEPEALNSATARPASSPRAVTSWTSRFRRPVLPRSKLCQPKSLMLMALTLGGIVLGFAVGFGVRKLNLSDDALMWVGMPGELFLRLLKLLILPLIVCSVISSTASLDPKVNGKISVVAFVFIVATNVIACVVAIVFSLLIRPGEGHDYYSSGINDEVRLNAQDIFADLLRNIIPDNLVQATFEKDQTKYNMEKREIRTILPNGTEGIRQMTVTTKQVVKASGVNVLGLIVFCSLIGIAINRVKDKAAVFLSFFSGATDVIIMVVRWIFWFTPLGVASLIASSIAGVHDMNITFAMLGWFVATVLIGLVLQGLVILPVILFVTTRRNPFAYLLSIVRPAMIGFASTSTAVALPEMLAACETNNIDSRAARFTIPFCVTLNADGSALFIVSAAIFCAQFTGVGLTVGDVAIIGFLTAVSSMALPSVPSSSMVTLIVILSSVNIPANSIALLFAVEWILDRARTVCNVISHTFCAAVTYQFCKKDLMQLETHDFSLDDPESTTNV